MMSMLLTLLFTFPLGGLLFGVRDITVHPVLVTSDNPGQESCTVGDDLAKLLEDADLLLQLSEIAAGHIHGSI
jgi:hypothetical protein